VAAKNGKDWAICGGAANRKRLFGASFIPKAIILPRQARDKHKKNTQKHTAFHARRGVRKHS
jgi:hypothetical protein